MSESPTITYNGIELTRYKQKCAGKNNSEYDGFYRGTDDSDKVVKYFIKKPNDNVEMFCELLAGRFIQKLKEKGFISKSCADLLVCADIIKLADGSYALIQPEVAFKELHKLTNTSYRDGSDRSPWYEIFFGKASYSDAIQHHKTSGVPSMLFLSLLVGDQSVHSGNVIWQKKRSLGPNSYRFGRIDWGAAWRNFCDSANGVLHPTEYQGLSAFKQVTKNYISNYTAIPGMLGKIQRQAIHFSHQLDKKSISLEDILQEVLTELPHDLLSGGDYEKLARYLNVDEKFVCKAFKGDPKKLAHNLDLAMQRRLAEMMSFQASKADHSEIRVKGIPARGVLSTSLAWLQQELQAVKPRMSGEIEDDSLRCYLSIDSAVFDVIKRQFTELLTTMGAEVPDLNDAEASSQFIQDIQDSALGKLGISYLELQEALKEFSCKKEVSTNKLRDLAQKLSEFNEQSVACLLDEEWNDENIHLIIESFYSLSFEQRKDEEVAFLKKVNDSKLLGKSQCRALQILSSLNHFPLNSIRKILKSDEYAKGVVQLEALHTKKSKLRHRAFLLQYPEVITALVGKQLNKQMVADLNALSTFVKDKLALNKGADYKRAMHDFFVESFKIRLSDIDNAKQKKQLNKAAHKHFKHRHFSARLLADAALVISSFFGVGIIIGVTREFMYGSYLFSTAKTKTEEDFSHHLDKACLK